VTSTVGRLLGAVYEHVEDAVLVVERGEPGHIVYVNPGFERMTGHASMDAIGKNIADLLRPRRVVGDAEVFAQTRADGQEYFVRRTRVALDEMIGHASLVLEIQRDVTGERALRDSEALYRKLAERASDLISRTDALGRCIYISPSCRDVLGYEPEELVGRHALVELAHPDDRAAQQQVLAKFVQLGQTSGSPLRRRIRRKDGSYVWLETVTHIERNADGRIVEVQSWARDIGARVAAEEALARAEASLRSLLDRLPDGVAVHRDGVILYANAAMLRVTGHDRVEDFIGRSLLDFVHPEERDSVRDRLADGGREGVQSRERRIVSRDGSLRILEITAMPVMFEGEVAFVAVCHDLTERKRMEEQLAAAARMASVGRLASGVGHEINNPLTYMLGNLELAGAEIAALPPGAPSGRLASHISAVREGAERVRNIVRDLKALSVAPDTRLGPVDVERTLDGAAATVDHEIRFRARLVRDYGRVPPVLASEGRLAQVFINLLVNAAQAIPDGEANDNEIRITTREQAGRIIVEISDTGVGIRAEDLPRIFDPFFTTKPIGVGTGLGLSISHTIVTAQGGTLTAERLPSRGALLRVTLPASAEAVAHATTPPPVTGGQPIVRVLIIDDEPQTTRVLAELLAPHDVTLAHSGREAIARLAADTTFDAIICDLQMNDGTGVDVYEYLRGHAPSVARRVIFTTGGAFTTRADEFLRGCPQPVLEKPFDPERLVVLVGQVARGEKTA
jgi:PAS domain S-box-containing protein